MAVRPGSAQPEIAVMAEFAERITRFQGAVLE
jgi:hypothetical protein